MNRPITQPAELLIKHLQSKIRQVETTGRNDDGTIVSSGSVDVDGMLPSGGYNRGTIVQWLSDRGCGAEYLSLLAAKNAARDGGAIVIIDHRGEFFPPAARAMGINLGNLIVLKGSVQCPEFGIQKKKGSESREVEAPAETPSRFNTQCSALSTAEDFLWAIDQSLRCPAVAAVWGQLPEFETPILAERWSRRFQLSAESSGCLGLFVTQSKRTDRSSQSSKATSLNQAIWSEVQWHLQPQLATTENTRTVRALLTRCRGGATGRAIDLEINLVTGNVQRARSEHATKRIRPSRPLSVACQLAHSKTCRRAAGA